MRHYHVTNRPTNADGQPGDLWRGEGIPSRTMAQMALIVMAQQLQGAGYSVVGNPDLGYLFRLEKAGQVPRTMALQVEECDEIECGPQPASPTPDEDGRNPQNPAERPLYGRSVTDGPTPFVLGTEPQPGPDQQR